MYLQCTAYYSRAKMIDLDKCGVFAKTINGTHGKTYVVVRVKEPNPHSKVRIGT